MSTLPGKWAAQQVVALGDPSGRLWAALEGHRSLQLIHLGSPDEAEGRAATRALAQHLGVAEVVEAAV